MIKKLILTISLMLIGVAVYAQKYAQKAVLHSKCAYVRSIPPLSQMDNIISAEGLDHEAPPKRQGKNITILGKGLPKGVDPLMANQMAVHNQTSKVQTNRAPSVNFDAHIGNRLNDPTGAVGPNHYVYAFNSGFGILDRAGNVLLPEASLATLFPGESLGDPIVVYDQFAERFVVMQFSRTPNSILLAVCQGSDPVNDGWFTYRFNTGVFPDYEKLSIWSDGYYITTNKSGGPTGQEVVYALERDKMLVGDPNAQFVGFNLPGAATRGFYSPGGFNTVGNTLAPAGVGHSVVYLQDDAWSGVSRDHLKIWTTDVNWSNPGSSSISQPQEIDTTPFDGVFDNGSFRNLDEPGSGADIDALQATMMYMTSYRRFPTHNSVVMNFVVDLDNNDSRAGIRWYELRQTSDTAPWTIYQEGTYVQPNGISAFAGAINIDSEGNIGMGYSVVSSSVFVSLRYTGRRATDPLGTMTLGEIPIVDGSRQSGPRTDGRYGDYSQLVMDPTDDKTFWYIGEYFTGEPRRRSRVAAFQVGDGNGGGGDGCTGGITSFPYRESFEGGIGQWSQATGDDLNWTVDANGTPSFNTGPGSAFDGSNYIYVEASGNGTGFPNKRAIINSPCFDLSAASGANFSFNYHMFGSNDMGSIALEASTNNGASWSTIWSQTGNQGNQWNNVNLNLGSFVGGSVQLRFNRVTGGTWQADIAIDNVRLTTGTSLGSRQEAFVLHKLSGEEATEFALYPNPATNTLNLEIASEKVGSIKIFSMYGKLIKEIDQRSQMNTVDISAFSAGTYFVRMVVEGQEITKKFVKQ